LVEHSLGKGEVTSSILVIGSMSSWLREVQVQDAWQILKWAWAVVVVVYCVLQVLASRRLRGPENKRSWSVLIVMAVLVAIERWIREASGNPLANRLAVVVVGIAAGIAALVLTRMLIAKKAYEGTADAHDAEEHIQSLNLN
jgi:hypothetical protein